MATKQHTEKYSCIPLVLILGIVICSILAEVYLIGVILELGALTSYGERRK